MNKIKVLQWTVALLVVLNISTIATIVYNNYRSKPMENETTIVLGENERGLNGRYFRQVIGFDNNQMDAYREVSHTFQPRANEIIMKIDSLKTEIYTELKKSSPNVNNLDRLAQQTGQMHAELKKETNAFYINIKQICTPMQFEKLDSIFSPLYCKKSCCVGTRNMQCCGRWK